jgi:hypothetical protein
MKDQEPCPVVCRFSFNNRRFLRQELDVEYTVQGGDVRYRVEERMTHHTPIRCFRDAFDKFRVQRFRFERVFFEDVHNVMLQPGHEQDKKEPLHSFRLCFDLTYLQLREGQQQ